MPAAAAVCYILSSTFFLALALEHCGLDPHCPADTTAVTMISVQHDPADGSLSLLSTTPRPVLREGELLVKVTIKWLMQVDIHLCTEPLYEKLAVVCCR